MKYTKKLMKTSGGLVVRVPSDIVKILNLSEKDYVEIDPRYFRPTEVEIFQGDPGKAMSKLGWKPKVKFKELVRIMVDADMKLAEQEKKLQQ